MVHTNERNSLSIKTSKGRNWLGMEYDLNDATVQIVYWRGGLLDAPYPSREITANHWKRLIMGISGN
jgi:hypothetical protein